MDLQLIRKLVSMMNKAELAEVEIDDREGGLRVHLRKSADSPPAPPTVQVLQGPGGEQGAASGLAPSGGAEPGPALAAEGETFDSPMVGTFYRAPAPDAEPFVDVGSRIQPELVLCIIEAMKVMNEIKSDVAGEILEVLVENGEPVEYGQPLFRIRRP